MRPNVARDRLRCRLQRRAKLRPRCARLSGTQAAQIAYGLADRAGVKLRGFDLAQGGGPFAEMRLQRVVLPASWLRVGRRPLEVILAHEVGHLATRWQFFVLMVLGLLVSFALHITASLVGGTTWWAAWPIYAAARRSEHLADREAARILGRPRLLFKMLRRGRGPVPRTRLEQVLATHPTGPERAAYLYRALAHR